MLDDAGGDDEVKEEKKVEGGGRPKVLADGTYATETAYTSAGSARLEAVKAASKPPLRGVCLAHPSRLNLFKDVLSALILGGDFFTGAVLASTLTKLVLRFDDLTKDRPKANALRAEVRTFIKVSLTFTNKYPVYVNHDICYPSWSIEIRDRTNR